MSAWQPDEFTDDPTDFVVPSWQDAAERWQQAYKDVSGENGRLREGLRRLRNLDYDSGYTAESYADAILTGFEPSGEASIPEGDGSEP